jgi:Zn-finger nucleic acid-binding protein
MKCPVCKEPDLVMTDRQSIEIDYCPQCRGVWLDRGELDKIIERSSAVTTAPAVEQSRPSVAEPRPQHPAHYPPQYPDYRRDKDDYSRDGYRPKKRKGFLGELFDFD